MKPAPEQEFHPLCFENHKAILIQSLTDFFTTKAYANVTLVCSEGEEITAHQTILAAYSSVFDRLLRGRSEHHPIIIFNYVSKKEMMTLLEFLYKGRVNVSKSKLPSFLRIVKDFQIRGFEHENLRRNEIETTSELREGSTEDSVDVEHQLLGMPNRVKIVMHPESPVIETMISMKREPGSEPKSKVINPFAMTHRSLEDSDSTFCEDQAELGPKLEVFSPPTGKYDSDVEIVDNNPVEKESQQVIDSSTQWFRKTQPKNKRKVRGSDDNAIGNLSKKSMSKAVIQDSEEEDVEDKEVRVNPLAVTNKNSSVKSNSSTATEGDDDLSTL